MIESDGSCWGGNLAKLAGVSLRRGGGGGMPCLTPGDCPATANECILATCDNGFCGTTNSPQGTDTTGNPYALNGRVLRAYRATDASSSRASVISAGRSGTVGVTSRSTCANKAGAA